MTTSTPSSNGWRAAKRARWLVVVDLVAAAPRIFALGAGRSGLALRMTAMRLMHLGLEVYVVGEVTTPAIATHDLFVTASGPGATAGILFEQEVVLLGDALFDALWQRSGSTADELWPRHTNLG